MYFTVPSCKRRLALAAVLLSALVLAGCAVAPEYGAAAAAPAIPGHLRHKQETRCLTRLTIPKLLVPTDRPVTVLSRMSETPLVCDDLGVTTTAQ